VGGVRAVCDKDCSKSCGTAGHQTLPAARQSLASMMETVIMNRLYDVTFIVVRAIRRNHTRLSCIVS